MYLTHIGIHLLITIAPLLVVQAKPVDKREIKRGHVDNDAGLFSNALSHFLPRRESELDSSNESSDLDNIQHIKERDPKENKDSQEEPPKKEKKKVRMFRMHAQHLKAGVLEISVSYKGAERQLERYKESWAPYAEEAKRPDSKVPPEVEKEVNREVEQVINKKQMEIKEYKGKKTDNPGKGGLTIDK